MGSAMFHSRAFDASAARPAAADAVFARFCNEGALSDRSEDRGVSIAVDELAFRMVVAFRTHPHINNVLTHISGGDWGKVERSLRVLLDPSRTGAARSSIEANLLDLMCLERGITGRIMKPYTDEVLFRIAGPRLALRLIQTLAGSLSSGKELCG